MQSTRNSTLTLVCACIFLLYACDLAHTVHAWQHQQKSTSDFAPPHSGVQSPLDKAGGLVYRTTLFSKEDFEAIKQECLSYAPHWQAEVASSVATKRRGMALPPNSFIFRLLSNPQGPLLQTLHTRVVGSKQSTEYCLSPEIPVEIRVYDQVGSGMDWHVDDVIYDPPQIEVIITIENTSDCATLWEKIPASALQPPVLLSSAQSETSTTMVSSQAHTQYTQSTVSITTTSDIERIETDPNSVLFLRAGGPRHCVTSLQRGRRIIVKFALVEKSAMFQSEQFTVNQFCGSKSRQGGRSGRDKSSGGKKRAKTGKPRR
jgi:hypothetical protein